MTMTNAMRRKTRTIELMMDNQWIYKISTTLNLQHHRQQQNITSYWLSRAMASIIVASN